LICETIAIKSNNVSSTKVSRFRKDFVRRIWNKFAREKCTLFPSYLSNVSTHLCESSSCYKSHKIHFSNLEIFNHSSSTPVLLQQFYGNFKHKLQFQAVVRAGFKGKANWAVAQGPPQLRGLHKKTVKNYYLKKHKNTSLFDLQETATKFVVCSF